MGARGHAETRRSYENRNEVALRRASLVENHGSAGCDHPGLMRRDPAEGGRFGPGSRLHELIGIGSPCETDRPSLMDGAELWALGFIARRQVCPIHQCADGSSRSTRRASGSFCGKLDGVLPGSSGHITLEGLGESVCRVNAHVAFPSSGVDRSGRYLPSKVIGGLIADVSSVRRRREECQNSPLRITWT